MTPAQALTLRLSRDGSTWCKVASGTIPHTLHLSLDGSPWWGVPAQQQEATIEYGNIKRVIKVDFGYIKKITI